MLLCWRGNLRMPDARLENTLAARLTLAAKIRELKPRVVILPYWEARHPDHYRAGEMGYEACFLAGLRKLDTGSEPHRRSRSSTPRSTPTCAPPSWWTSRPSSSGAWPRC